MPTPEATIRAFLAVTFPEGITARVGEIVEGLRGVGDVRWATPEQFHVTLKFLGNLEMNDLPGLVEKVAAAAKTCSPFMVELGGVGAFPSVTRPRVVWLGAGAGSRPLGELARSVEAACAAAGFPHEERPFRAHVTLGRVRSPRDLKVLAKRLQETHVEPLPPFRVAEVVLMQSQLRPGGAVYSVRERFPLLGQESGAA